VLISIVFDVISVGNFETTLKNYTIDDLRRSVDAWIRLAKCSEPKLEPMYYHRAENQVINAIAAMVAWGGSHQLDRVTSALKKFFRLCGMR
jgi:hypothetical protein